MSVSRPFFSNATRWSGRLFFDYFTGQKKFFEHAEEVFDFPAKEKTIDLYLSHTINSARTRRLTLNYFNTLSFFSTNIQAAEISRIDYGQITISLSHLRQYFTQVYHIDGFGEIEDASLGTGYTLAVGFSHPLFLDQKTAGYCHLEFAHNHRLGESGLGQIRTRFSSRIIGNGFEALWYELNWYEAKRIGAWQTLAGRLRVDLTQNFPVSAQLFLDGSKHIRGYQLRQEEGQSRWVFNIEDRLFTPLRLYKVRFGAVLFFDVGGIWRESWWPERQRLLSAVGLGLRIDPHAAYGGRLTSIDFTFPLTGEKGLHISFSTDQFFNALQKLNYIFHKPRLFLPPT